MLQSEILKPSAMGAGEREKWDALIRADQRFQRGFLTYGFARACETAYGRARVAVLHEGGAVRGFIPFQFMSALHEQLGSAMHIGEAMSDAAGIITEPGVTCSPADVLRLTGAAQFYVTHLLPSQSAFGVEAEEAVEGHAIDIAAGADDYFATLHAANKKFVQDTNRCARKLEEAHGAVEYARTANAAAADVDEIIAGKRRQYAETGAKDVFADPRRRDLVHALRQLEDPLCTPVLQTLTAGGARMACHFGLQCLGALSYWFPVYQEDARRFSPGRLLLWEMIAHSAAEGVSVIDMGAGGGRAKECFSNAPLSFGKAIWRGGGVRGGAARALTAVGWRLAALKR